MSGQWFFAIVSIFLSIIPAIIYVVAAYLIIGDVPITAGTIVAFTTVQSRLLFPTVGLLRVVLDLQTSGALFAGTAVIAALGWFDNRRRGTRMAIVQASRVPEGTAHYFNYPDPDDQAVLLHLPGGEFVAYSQKCTHLSCAVYYAREAGRLECPCHEGYFAVEDGRVLQGPPQRPLPRIVIERHGAVLMATGVEVRTTGERASGTTGGRA